MLVRKTLKGDFGFITAAVQGNNNVNKTLSIKVKGACLIDAAKIERGNIFILENSIRSNADRRFSEGYKMNVNDLTIELVTSDRSSIRLLPTVYRNTIDMNHAVGNVVFNGIVASEPRIEDGTHIADLSDEQDGYLEISSGEEMPFHVGDRVEVTGNIIRDSGIISMAITSFTIIDAVNPDDNNQNEAGNNLIDDFDDIL